MCLHFLFFVVNVIRLFSNLSYRARVSHVACDAIAWPSCEKSAVSLKNEFECQLIPSRCYTSHKDNIDSICPNTGKF